jgi:F0F1-type ATP synthase gamma subunit
MALSGKYNSNYAACLKNAVNFLVAQKYKIDVFAIGNAGI